MKTVFNPKMRKLLSVVLVLCMVFSLFAGTGVVTLAETETAIQYWDGWQGDEYADLASVQADLDGSGTESDPYIVTNADQLYAVIYYGGGDFVSIGNAGICYKLANDLYLNTDYENYADWDTTAPDNKWMANDGSVDFNGTIDGDGHTIYGYYNSGKFTALIPYYDTKENSATFVKNLNMEYCAAVSANRFVSFIFAGTNGGGSGGNQIFINNCTVRKSEMFGLYKSAGGGAILGIAGRRAVIDNCAVTDVIFNYTPTSNGGGTDRSNEHSIGSIVGGSQSGSVNLDNYTESEVTTMASNIYITLTNSYAVNNTLNNTSTGNSYLVYPIGIFQSWANCYYCAMANNVYTDSTTIPSYTWKKDSTYTYTIKLRVAAVGSTTEIPSDDEAFPIETITADSIKGTAAMNIMPDLAWGTEWMPVSNGYPVPESGNLDGYWDGWQGDEYDSLASVQADLDGAGTVVNPYIITDADQLYAVIYYGGGDFVSVGNAGTCYKLANDLYLNYGYEDYADWDTVAPANKWLAKDGATNFNGTIDGDGHTIYGYYNDGGYVGLIPYHDVKENSTVYVKNLNMKYCASTNAIYRVGFIYGGTNGGGSGGNQVFITNCTVRNGEMSGIYGSACNGALVGIAGRRTIIDKCAVTDVIFNFAGNWGGNHPLSNTNSKEASIGAMVGGPMSAGSTDVNAVPTASGSYITVTNSYSVGNILNNARDNTSYLVYPIGINQSWGTYYNRAVASNVYTDSTTIPTYSYTSDGVTTNPTLRLTVPGGTDVVLPTDENYPIKTVSAENLIGEGAKTAMPTFNWALYWSTVENDYPIPEDKSDGKVWDGTKVTSIEGLGMKGTGTKEDPYVITNGTELYASIFSGGNGCYYVIGNDIVLNADYLDYKNWGTTAPSNVWKSSSSTDFLGHIDGQGYTIYGFYASGSNSGLIPRLNITPYAELVTIKNINMSHAYIASASYYAGFISGAVYWSGSKTVEINGCNVRNGAISGIVDNSRTGGILGAACSKVTIANCSASDIDFTMAGANTTVAGWNATGSILGCIYTAATTIGVYNADGANRVKVIDCFAVNCTRTNDGSILYPIGISGEVHDGYERYYLSASARNVYTDAVVTDIPSVTTSNTQSGEEITFSLKLSSLGDTSTAIDPTSADYPVKQITVDGIKGDAAKTAMADLNWCHFDTVSGSIPAWADNHTEEVVSAVAPTCTETGLTEGTKCSTCSEILVEQETVSATGHDFSGEWADTESGKLLTCKNCEESKFKADITVDNAHITSEEDVFTVGTVIGITKLTEGTEYDAVNAAIPAEPKRAEVYTITSTTEQNGTATLSITAPTEWNTTDAVICLLTDSGNLRKVETTLENGVATAQIAVMGTYALIDLSSATFVGDVDGDSKINATDLAVLREFFLGDITAEEIGGTLDVNRDSKENAVDIVVLKKYLANLGQ